VDGDGDANPDVGSGDHDHDHDREAVAGRAGGIQSLTGRAGFAIHGGRVWAGSSVGRAGD
jgi:hypothetical protein